MGLLSKNRREKKCRPLVETCSEEPESHSTAISALDVSVDEHSKRFSLKSLISRSTPLKPRFGREQDSAMSQPGSALVQADSGYGSDCLLSIETPAESQNGDIVEDSASIVEVEEVSELVQITKMQADSTLPNVAAVPNEPAISPGVNREMQPVEKKDDHDRVHAKCERQAMKVKLAIKHKMMKQEAEKINRLKKESHD